jgi:hypothetical protein
MSTFPRASRFQTSQTTWHSRIPRSTKHPQSHPGAVSRTPRSHFDTLDPSESASAADSPSPYLASTRKLEGVPHADFEVQIKVLSLDRFSHSMQARLRRIRNMVTLLSMASEIKDEVLERLQAELESADCDLLKDTD